LKPEKNEGFILINPITNQDFDRILGFPKMLRKSMKTTIYNEIIRKNNKRQKKSKDFY